MKYQEIKNEQHIFIYGINGRSSSTALQRILNSSGEICIWGEAGGIDQPFLDFIEQIETKKKDFDERLPKDHYDLLKNSFKNEKHDKFYPNAFNDLTESIECIKDGFAEMIKPVNSVKRLGYKEIRVQKPSNLITLIKLFPNCKILFLFRDTKKQWICVRDTGWFGFSNDLEKFNAEYIRIGNTYTEVFDSHPDNCIFVENKTLYSKEKVKNLVSLLNLSSYDESLINKVVSSQAKNGLSEDEEQMIRATSFKKYEKLKELVPKNL